MLIAAGVALVVILALVIWAILRPEKKKCSFCLSGGHDYKTCPDLMMRNVVPPSDAAVERYWDQRADYQRIADYSSRRLREMNFGTHGYAPRVAQPVIIPPTVIVEQDNSLLNTVLAAEVISDMEHHEAPVIDQVAETPAFHGFGGGDSGGGGASSDWSAPDTSSCDTGSSDTGSCDAGGGSSDS